MMLLGVLRFNAIAEMESTPYKDQDGKECMSQPYKLALCDSLDSVFSKAVKCHVPRILPGEEIRLDCDPPSAMGEYLVEIGTKVYEKKVTFRILRIIAKVDMNTYLSPQPPSKKEKSHAS